jgi:hypoxanthine phosphoribosyltransferase
MSKPVITLDKAALKRTLGELWTKLQDDGHQPDMIVGIASGGLICAQLLDLPPGVVIHACRLKRPTSDNKRKNPVTQFLRHLPYPVTDQLRRLEDWWLERQSCEPYEHPDSVSVQLDEDLTTIAADVAWRGAQCILVLDDAVDSGMTFKTVYGRLRARLPAEVVILSAAVTQTRGNSAFATDYRVYSNTICRFHWSFDYRDT